MNETPQQYIARILGNLDGKEPFAVQRATAGRLDRLIRGLSPSQLRRRPVVDKWSIAEIIGHLAESELVVGYRIRTILSSNGAPIQGFDQDEWAKTTDYARRDTKKFVGLFRELRAATLDLLKSVPKEKWENFGMHSERGKETVSHIVRLIAGHDLNHLRQIEGIRAQVSRTTARRKRTSRRRK